MIKLKRTRNPKKVTSTLRGKALEKKILNLLLKRIQYEAEGLKGSFKVASKWKPAKKTLLEESHNKCCFCESEVPSTYNGDVEHFRPKSIYWWLSYTIDNYLLSCRVCNSNKSNSFEVIRKQKVLGPLPDLNDEKAIIKFVKKYAIDPVKLNNNTREVGLESLKRYERPQLLNPYIDDPAKYFRWVYSDVNQEVMILPKKRLSASKKRNANYTIELLKLNRSHLARKRYQKAVILKEIKILGGTLSRIRPLFFESKHEYSFMQEHLYNKNFPVI